MQMPKPLLPGSRLAIVAPSFIADHDILPLADQKLRQLGFLPVFFPSCFASWEYFSGSDALRGHDINRAFADSSIDGILCLRGGYGAIRLLPLLDYTTIQRHPKAFIGYSDITALHLVLQQKCQLATFHGPMAKDLIDADECTVNSFMNAVGGGDWGDWVNWQNPNLLPIGCPASAKGVLTGGNLTTLCSLLGTPYEPDFHKKILFLEEVNEAPYRIDRMLTSLILAGKLQNCAGFLLGSFTGCQDDHGVPVEEVLHERLLPLAKPVLTGLPAGHIKPMLTLHLGTLINIPLEESH